MWKTDGTRGKMTLEIRNNASHGDQSILRRTSPASLTAVDRGMTAVDRGMNGTVEHGSYMQLVLGYRRTTNSVGNGLSTWQTPANKTCMNWQAAYLDKEWRRFKQHCEFTFKGPLATNPGSQKVNYLMTYIGDTGREIYDTFIWTPATDVGPAENTTHSTRRI